MKTFKDDFYKFLNKLKNNEHFSFSKYSDGELFILQGQELILDENHHGYNNSEDYKNFNPNDHAFFKNMLSEAFKFSHKNYYIGICAPSDQNDETFFWMKKESGRDEEHLSWANLFVNSNYEKFRKELIPELNNKKVVIVCNEKSNTELLPFQVVKDFRVGSNCIINNISLIDEMKNYIIENDIKNHVFLFAASSLGNVLIHKLTELFPENTYFDVGSCLNPLLGLSVDRGYLSAYEGVLWRGQDTSEDLKREETWKIKNIENMELRLVKNSKEYYEFIRFLRTDERNSSGFVEKVEITKEQQEEYMSKFESCYFICLDGDTPIGFIGEVNDDIRLAVHPEHKRKGIGKFMLNEFMKFKPKSVAKVLWGNDASVFLFNSAGFVQYAKDKTFIYFKKSTLDNTVYRRPIHNPFKVVKMFEEEVADYTKAPYAVAVDNCTNALFLVCKYLEVKDVTIPSKTYLSVPQSIIHAGGTPIFDSRDEANNWNGVYQLKPYPVYDAAKRFTSGMYIPGTFMCLSFHIKKQLKIGKGGMILTDSLEAVEWFKKARYEGRSEKLYHEDDIDSLGWNMYMTPQQASHGLALMQNYPLHVDDLGENNGYRDLTEFSVFKNYKKIV